MHECLISIVWHVYPLLACMCMLLSIVWHLKPLLACVYVIYKACSNDAVFLVHLCYVHISIVSIILFLVCLCMCVICALYGMYIICLLVCVCHITNVLHLKRLFARAWMSYLLYDMYTDCWLVCVYFFHIYRVNQ